MGFKSSASSSASTCSTFSFSYSTILSNLSSSLFTLFFLWIDQIGGEKMKPTFSTFFYSSSSSSLNSNELESGKAGHYSLWSDNFGFVIDFLARKEEYLLVCSYLVMEPLIQPYKWRHLKLRSPTNQRTSLIHKSSGCMISADKLTKFSFSFILL